jgi:Cys-tRNA(Pro)/Cys-tRNA(Cys) deacylase
VKTNAARILDTAKIHYETKQYEVDPEDLSAVSVAKKVGIPIEQVYKTLVCRGEKSGPLFAVIRGDHELDLKQLAVAANDRKCHVVALKEVQPMTGYIRGGVTVLGAKKAFPVYVDSGILSQETVSVSGGMRGVQILIAPEDYVRVTGAKLVDGLGRAPEGSGGSSDG